MENEYLDIVDDEDHIVNAALYQDVYKNLSPHRVVHILIFNKKGDLLLQLRAKHRNFAPLHWSTSVGGHVRSGETYKQAAIREAKEELGILPRITKVYKDRYMDTKGHIKFLTTYKAVDTGYTFTVDPEEVERVEYKNLQEIRRMQGSGILFHPELTFLLKKHFHL
jgi:isopentenyldiphosphate isomerase